MISKIDLRNNLNYTFLIDNAYGEYRYFDLVIYLLEDKPILNDDFSVASSGESGNSGSVKQVYSEENQPANTKFEDLLSNQTKFNELKKAKKEVISLNSKNNLILDNKSIAYIIILFVLILIVLVTLKFYKNNP